MRNKGFFWFLTILLTAVCLYQLSFTWVSNSEESKAEKEAKTMVAELMASIKANGDTVVYLPNSTSLSVNKLGTDEIEELAQAAYVNDILRTKAEKPVYPIFGSTFKEVKKRSLAFGLDLVGGMSVTMEISVPDLVKSYVRNERDPNFTQIFNPAKAKYDRDGGDFIRLFMEEAAKRPNIKLARVFILAEIEDLGSNSSNDEVEAFLREREKSSMDGVEKIMERRINQFGVAQPNIQKDPGNNRLYIELPGVQDEASVAEKLIATANLEFFELEDFNRIAPNWQEAVALSKGEMQEEEEIEEADTTIAAVDSNLVDSNASESLLSGMDEVSGKVGGAEGLDVLVNPIGDTRIGWVESKNRAKVDKLLQREDIKRAFSDLSIRFMWSSNAEPYGENKETGFVLYACRIPEDGKARVGGTDISKARRDYDQQAGEVIVSLEMTQEGADKWAQMTEENQGRQVAITMDGIVFSAPRVNEPIRGGTTQISGGFSVEEADDLAGLLNGGALPAPCIIKEQTRVGPTIGAENSKSGLMSFGIALLIVFAYMIFYYGKAGIVADIALMANILFIFGSLASFGAVLTLAGLAGIVLTIGMAVDANVLIFERIREEQAAGKDQKSAIDTGFQKALSSIIDANVTTLLTAVVLKMFGSGPIESFATTLIIGIFTSVFAALVITRLSINWWLNKGKSITFETKTTKNALKNTSFDFVGKRKMYYAFSGILIVGGIAAIVFRGLNPSVEFSGGRTFGVKFEKSAQAHTEKVISELKKVFVEDGKIASVEAKTKSSSYLLEITTNYMRSNETSEAGELVREKLNEGLANCEAELGSATILETRSVSPTVSRELLKSSSIAILLSLIIIFAYILLRFGKWQYSTGAILAMMHDVVIVLSVFALLHGILPFNMDIDQAFIAAILTVIGYSINDTVIVFDRIRENLGLMKGTDESANINSSLNSTLSRTVNTSMTTFVVLLVIFLFGGTAIKGFVFALMIGVLVGTYSSLCIATPILIDLSKKLKRAK